jgi:hypothetical protein
MESAMDTVYSVVGGFLPANSTLMTVYHGRDNARIIVSGFDLWTYRKTQVRQVIEPSP